MGHSEAGVYSKGTREPWQSFEQGRVTVMHKKDPFGYHVQGRMERVRVEVWSTGGGQGRNPSGRPQGWIRAGLWGEEEEVGERQECEWTLGLGLRGEVRGGGAGMEVV